MTILSIETSTNVCSVAWCINGQCVAERIHTEGSNHAALLPQFIDQLLDLATSNGWHADAVAISIGPGSYTGLRIGLSTAKGLCYGWNVPLIPVPTLDILCEVALSHIQLSTFNFPLSTYFVPMLDARRMEIYTGIYRLQSNQWCNTIPVTAQVVTDYAWLPQNEPICYFGDGAAKCQDILNLPSFHYLDQIIPRASVMGALVQRMNYTPILEKQLAYYTPFYLKEFIAAPSHIKGLK